MLASTVQFSTFGRTIFMITAWSIERLVQCEEARPGSFDPGPKEHPFPQDPTACLGLITVKTSFPRLAAVLGNFGAFAPHVNVPPMS